MVARPAYRYLVVRLERTRRFDAAAVSLTTAGEQQLQVQIVHSDDGTEVRLYCYSPARKSKEQAILKKPCARFEKQLQELHEGLSRCGRTRNRGDLASHRASETRSSGAGQHYQIKAPTDSSGQQATAVTCELRPVASSKLTHPAVYRLRSNQTDWDAEAIWRPEDYSGRPAFR